MELIPLRGDAPLVAYQHQADSLLARWQSADATATQIVRSRHPRFLDDKIPWLQRRMTDAEARTIALDRDDARLALARWYDFHDWPALEEHARTVAEPGPVQRFERAIEAVIAGDAATLADLLREDPDLVRARSTRVNYFDPPRHRATLLHYLAANGVETYRQKSPSNAVEIARMLLDAGADPNALHDAYGGQNTTLTMLVSSAPPRIAGVQVPLIETLMDYGASVEPLGKGQCADPLMTAIIHGNLEAALVLERRGRRVDALPAAAGLGRIADVERMLPSATAAERHSALAVAAQHGHTAIVKLLADSGEDLDRFNPEGHHAHATPLHQAIANGHVDTAKWLIDRGARLDMRDRIFQSTPLGWADYLQQPAVAEYLRRRGAVE